MGIKILVAGDLHIGKKSASLNTDAEEITTKYSWGKLVDYAIQNQIDVLALTGDIVDQDNKYFEAIGPLQNGFEQLKKEKIAVFMVAGNHDFYVLPELLAAGKYENVHLLGANGKWEIKTFSSGGKQVQFVGWSFPKRYVNEDPFTSFTEENIDPNFPAIGMLHGDYGNLTSNYAPISPNNFSQKYVQAWLLGHIHKPAVLRETTPLVFYPGSLHALSAKEQGKHGAVLLTVNSIRNLVKEEIAFSPVRYESIDIDISGIGEIQLRDALSSKVIENARSKLTELENVSFLVYDIRLTGQHSNISDLQDRVYPMIEDFESFMEGTSISVRKIALHIRPKVENIEELAKETSPAGVLAKSILELEKGETSEFTERLVREWKTANSHLQTAGTYEPLKVSGAFEMEFEPEKYLLDECKRLLTELIGQQPQ